MASGVIDALRCLYKDLEVNGAPLHVLLHFENLADAVELRNRRCNSTWGTVAGSEVLTAADSRLSADQRGSVEHRELS